MVAERSAADMKTLNKHVGKIYYHLCPDDKRFFRTIRIHHNPFTNSTQPQVSNPVYGTPPPELEPIPPLMLSRLMRVQNTSSFI